MYLIWYTHMSRLSVGSPNSSCKNVALFLSMGLTFLGQTVLWLKKKKEVIKYNLLSQLPLPPNHSSPFPVSLRTLSPPQYLPPSLPVTHI